MRTGMTKLQREIRLHEKTLSELAKRPIQEQAPAKNRDSVKPSIRVHVYTIGTPPPHLCGIGRDLLGEAYQRAQGDWYLIEPLAIGVRVHNNRHMANAYRKSHRNIKS